MSGKKGVYGSFKDMIFLCNLHFGFIFVGFITIENQ